MNSHYWDRPNVLTKTWLRTITKLFYQFYGISSWIYDNPSRFQPWQSQRTPTKYRSSQMCTQTQENSIPSVSWSNGKAIRHHRKEIIKIIFYLYIITTKKEIAEDRIDFPQHLRDLCISYQIIIVIVVMS